MIYRMRTFSRIISVFIGGIFLFSGITKVISVYHFQYILYGYGIPHLDLLAPVVIILELMLAFNLLFGIHIKSTSLATTILLITFTIGYTYGYYFHGIVDCGCFGTLIRQPSNKLVYARNFVLIILSNILYFTCDTEKQRICGSWRGVVLLVYMALSCFLCGLTFRPMLFFSPKSHPYMGLDINQTPLCDFAKPHKEEYTLLTFFSYSCTHCINSMENLLAAKRYNLADTVIYVAVTKETDNVDSLRNAFGQYYNDLGQSEVNKADIPFIEYMPTTFIIHNDTIDYVQEGEFPSPYAIPNHLRCTH